MARSNIVLRTFVDGANEFQVFKCEAGNHEFSRPTTRGVKPMNCPDHGGISRPVVKAPKVAAIPAAVNPAPANPRHYRFSLIAAMVKCGVHVFLVGPAGSGKSTVATQVAEEMGIQFYAESGHELMTAYDLLGFRNANGDFVVTNLARAVEFGGIFLMDEMDAMNAAALVAVNNIAALRPGQSVRFGDREVIVSEDFHLIGGGNTWGRGANGAYNSRQVIDAATLDRFACIEFGYDGALEFMAAGVPVPAHVPAQPRYKRGTAADDATVSEWVTEVQRYRAAFLSSGIEDAMVTPRASIAGGAMLRAGIHRDYVLAALIRRGLSDDEWRSVKAHMPVAV